MHLSYSGEASVAGSSERECESSRSIRVGNSLIK